MDQENARYRESNPYAYFDEPSEPILAEEVLPKASDVQRTVHSTMLRVAALVAAVFAIEGSLRNDFDRIAVSAIFVVGVCACARTIERQKSHHLECDSQMDT